MAYQIGPTIAVQGEKDFASAMKNIKQQMTYVKAEANAMTSAYGANDRSMAALTAKSNALNGALNVQKQAVKAAEDALQRMKNQGVDPSTKAYKDMEANLNNAKSMLNKTSNEIKENETALKNNSEEAERAAAKHAKFKEALSGVAAVAGKAVVVAAKAAAIAIAAIATACIAAAVAVYKLAKNAGEAADALITLSNQTGVSAKTLQEWGYAARFVDTDIETMTKGLAKTVKAMGEAVKAGNRYVDVSDGLSVSMYDANGNLRDSEDMFYALIDGLGAMTNETEREIAAQELFGKSYQDMLPLIKAGAGALRDYAAEAQKLGLILSDDEVMSLGAFDDSLQKVSAQFDIMGKRIALIFLPAIQAAVGEVSAFVSVVVAALSDGFQQSDIATIGTYITEKITNGMKKVAEYLPGIIAAIGNALNQIVAIIVEVLPTVLPVFTQAAFDLLAAFIDTLAANAPAIGTMIVEIVGQFATFLIEETPVLMQAVAGIVVSIAQGLPALITQLAAAFTANLPIFIQAITDMITGVLAVLPEILTALAEAAPMIITAVVVALVAALPQLIEGVITCVLAIVDNLPTIKQALIVAIPTIIAAVVEGLIANIPALISGLIQIVAAVVLSIPQIIAALLQAIPQIIVALVNGFKSGWGQARQVSSGYVDQMKQGITERWGTMVTAVKGYITQWIAGISTAFNSIVSVGANIVNGLWNGIKSAWSGLVEKFKGLASNLVSGVKNMLGIHSPSTVFAGIGENMALGLGAGFADAMKSIGKDINGNIPTMDLLTGSKSYSSVVFQVTNPSEAWLDYAYNKFNIRLGAEA